MGIRERRLKQLLDNLRETRRNWKLKHEALNNRHLTDFVVKKLRAACYIITIIKTNMSASVLKIIYHAFIHSVMSYGIIFWGDSSYSSTVFSMQKKGIRIMEGCGNGVLCRNLYRELQILRLTSNFYCLY
jgi:hypothetical protein